MIKAEEFENCLLLAISNNVQPIAKFGVGMGGRTQSLVKVSSVLVIPLDEHGLLTADKAQAIEDMKKAASLLELQEICKKAGITWI